MANRTIEQKKLKMKRRNRHAIFSGPAAKYAVRVDRGKYEGVTKVGEDLVPSGKHVVVPVGPISLSKAVINTGRGPDKERMQEYYNRARNFDIPLPETIGISAPLKEMYENYDRMIEQNKIHRVSLVKDYFGQLDLVFSSGGNEWLFIEINYRQKSIKRSKIYRSRKFAMQMLEFKKITWVEHLSSP